MALRGVVLMNPGNDKAFKAICNNRVANNR